MRHHGVGASNTPVRHDEQLSQPPEWDQPQGASHKNLLIPPFRCCCILWNGSLSAALFPADRPLHSVLPTPLPIWPPACRISDGSLPWRTVGSRCGQRDRGARRLQAVVSPPRLREDDSGSSISPQPDSFYTPPSPQQRAYFGRSRERFVGPSAGRLADNVGLRRRLFARRRGAATRQLQAVGAARDAHAGPSERQSDRRSGRKARFVSGSLTIEHPV